MLTGNPPYYNDNLKELFRNIHHEKLTFPKNVKADAKSLMAALLNRTPEARPKIDQIKAHPFFKKINWQQLAAK